MVFNPPLRRHQCVVLVAFLYLHLLVVFLGHCFPSVFLISFSCRLNLHLGALVSPDRLQYCTFSLSPKGGNETLCSALAGSINLANVRYANKKEGREYKGGNQRHPHAQMGCGEAVAA